MDHNLLEIKDLYVQYTADGRAVEAVNGITITVKRAIRWDSSEKPAQARQQLRSPSWVWFPIHPER